MSYMESSVQHQVHDLYRDHHGWLKGWLRGKVGNNADAGDLAHDTFLRMLSGRSLVEILKPREYLATIARGLVADKFRRQAVEQAYLETLAARPQDHAVSPEERAMILETLVAIDRMLDEQGARAREIFLLSQFEGLTYPQIGERLGVSVTTVKKHLVRVLTRCLQLSLA